MYKILFYFIFLPVFAISQESDVVQIHSDIYAEGNLVSKKRVSGLKKIGIKKKGEQKTIILQKRLYREKKYVKYDSDTINRNVVSVKAKFNFFIIERDEESLNLLLARDTFDLERVKVYDRGTTVFTEYYGFDIRFGKGKLKNIISVLYNDKIIIVCDFKKFVGGKAKYRGELRFQKSLLIKNFLKTGLFETLYW